MLSTNCSMKCRNQLFCCFIVLPVIYDFTTKFCINLLDGWNNDLWGGELPSASWIDEITPHHPVWLSRMDGHMGLANSLALKIAGVTSNMQDPVGGTITRNANGEATVLMIDSAMKVILSCIPEVSVEERREALDRASRYALMRGLTTVVDFGRYFPGASLDHSWEDFSGYSTKNRK